MTGAEALARALAPLNAAGVEDAMVDARRLLAAAWGLAPDRLTLHLPEPLPDTAATRFQQMVQARVARQPVAQILGQRIFWGRAFVVTPDVLDPRPETEVLLAAALAEPFDRVLDLGTGTGCLLLSLLAERPGATGLGVDLSEAALNVARANRAALKLERQAELAMSDWFQTLTGRFDLIVANPPYIAAAEMADLAPEVRLHEPHLALTDGGDGLGAYRAIAAGLPRHLAPGGRVLMEIGPRQGAAVTALLAEMGLTDLKVLPDWDGRDRVVTARG